MGYGRIYLVSGGATFLSAKIERIQRNGGRYKITRPLAERGQRSTTSGHRLLYRKPTLKRNTGIPTVRLCRYGELAPDVASTGQRGCREHRTLKMSKYNLDVIDEEKRDPILRKGRKKEERREKANKESAKGTVALCGIYTKAGIFAKPKG